MYHRTATTEAYERKLGIPPLSGGDAGGEFGVDEGIRPKEVEFVRALYCDATNSGPL